jgi:histidine ammonia-lyase
MTVVLAERAELTLDVFERVAWGGEGVRISSAALERIAAARTAFEALLDDPDITIYGVTSGYGDRASIRLDPAGRREQAARGPGWLRLAFGEPLPERVSRGIVLARLASMLEGHAAVRPVVVEAVAALLDGPLPPVPVRGHGGAGEIVPLGHLFGGLAELGLLEKETIALVNGSPCAAALVADAALSARRRLAIAEAVFALSAEAAAAPLEAYAPELEGLWEDEHEAASLRRFRELLEGGAHERRAYQAPVCYRILPRVLGQVRRAVAEAERAASVSLRAVTDNPVFVPATGRILSNGSYHNAQAPAALDNLAGAWADLARLAERHVQVLVHDVLGADGGDRPPFHMLVVGYAEEAEDHGRRTPLPPGGPGQNDVASPGFLAWRSQEAAAECFVGSLAILVSLASLVLDRAGRGATPALAPLLERVREHAPPTAFPAAGYGVGALADSFAAEIVGAGVGSE